MTIMQDHNGEWLVDVGDATVTIDEGKYCVDMLGFDASNQSLYFNHAGRILSNEELGIDNDPHYMEDYDGIKFVLLGHGGGFWKLHKITRAGA